MRRYITISLVMLFVSVVCGCFVQAQAHQSIVRVLAYPFPPFLNEDGKTGLTPELLNLLNSSQGQYVFKIKVVRPEERYENMMSGQQHMILFEMPKWNWQDKMNALEETRTLLKDGEIYIAKRNPNIDQSYFDDVKTKHIGAYEGYHYEFANYNSDRKWLEANFNITFANRHLDILSMVEAGDIEIGVVPLSFLKKHFLNNPDDIAKYEISHDFAQVYHLKALIRKDAPIKVDVFENLLNNLKKDFILQDYLEKNGILRQWKL